MKKRSVCVLVSGGMDSAVLLHHALGRFPAVHPLFVRCGLVWERAELYWLGKYLQAVRRPGLKPLAVAEAPAADVYPPHWSLTGKRVPGYSSRDEEVYLPGRNVLLLSKAAVFCAVRKIPRIELGVLKATPFPDATPRFFRAMERALSAGLGSRISVRAPFAALSKEQVLRRGRGLPLH